MLDRPSASAAPAERPDPVVAGAVGLIVLTLAGLVVGGVLAVYDWRTPDAEIPLFAASGAAFLAAIAVLVVGAGVRWARSGGPR